MRQAEIIESTPVRKQEIVCILGMHRSGTSVLARLLNLLGVDLGSDDAFTTEPVAHNPRGYWEHSELSSISDAILKRHGGSWDEPPVLPLGWENDAAIDDLRYRAAQLIADQFANVALWGWKDPRSCLTLPFWQQLLPDMRYIICLRNPVDVARSLADRDNLTAEQSSNLWLAYVSSALRHSEGKPRLIIFYEDLMDDSGGELQRLANFLGMPERARRLDLQDAVRGFIDEGLQHHRTSVVECAASTMIDFRARALYLAQRISTSLGRKETGSDIEIQKALDSLSQSSFSPWPSETDGMVYRLSTQVAAQARALQSQAEYAEETIRALTDQLRETQIQLQSIRTTFAWRLWNRCGRFFRGRGTRAPDQDARFPAMKS